MTISHSKFVMSKPTKALLNDEVIEIFHQAPIQRTSAAWKRAEAAVASSTKVLAYGICTWVEKGSDRLGSIVCRIPENHSGVSSENMDADLEQVGTLLQQGRKWYVETDLKRIEIMRRAIETQKMRDRKLSKGEFGYDYEAYSRYLSARDKDAGRFITRGHGLDGDFLVSQASA